MPASPTANPDAILSFGLFADAHYARDRIYADRHCHDSLLKLRACIDTFNARGLTMAVNLGDLIDCRPDGSGELDDLAAVRDVFASFRGERHYVLGNHDVQSLTKEQFYRHCGAERPDPWFSFNRAGLHFVVLDGNCKADGSDFAAGDFDWADAWISQAQLDWLASDLRAAHDRRTILFCHEDIDHRLWESALDPCVVRNAAAVRAILEAAGNVWAVFEGHAHEGLQSIQNGIPYFAPATMVVGPGLANNSFAIVSLRRDGAIAIEGFGRQKSLLLRSEP